VASKKHNRNFKNSGQRDFPRPKQVWDEETHVWKKVK